MMMIGVRLRYVVAVVVGGVIFVAVKHDVDHGNQHDHLLLLLRRFNVADCYYKLLPAIILLCCQRLAIECCCLWRDFVFFFKVSVVTLLFIF